MHVARGLLYYLPSLIVVILLAPFVQINHLRYHRILFKCEYDARRSASESNDTPLVYQISFFISPYNIWFTAGSTPAAMDGRPPETRGPCVAFGFSAIFWFVLVTDYGGVGTLFDSWQK